MSIVEVHNQLANTTMYYFFILGIWGLWRFARRQGVDGNYWGALFIGELVILIQGVLGAYLWYSGLRPVRSLHLLYGIFTALVIPAVYAYTRGHGKRREMLIYSVTTLVMVGLIVRAITTGG
ncbi:MAG: hypothetical protein ACE5JP_14170 [Candidatus Bipolaricaulia bacterium]